MTKSERLKTELQHLINLAAPPYHVKWMAYVKRKAEILRDWDSTYADLPVLLDKALQSNSKNFSQPQNSIEGSEDARP